MKKQHNEEWEKMKAIEKHIKEEARLYRQAKKLKLKPCPFCGKKAEIILSGQDSVNGQVSGRYVVGCCHAGCAVKPRAGFGNGGFVEEIPELVDAWNRRMQV